MFLFPFFNSIHISFVKTDLGQWIVIETLSISAMGICNWSQLTRNIQEEKNADTVPKVIDTKYLFRYQKSLKKYDGFTSN